MLSDLGEVLDGKFEHATKKKPEKLNPNTLSVMPKNTATADRMDANIAVAIHKLNPALELAEISLIVFDLSSLGCA